MSGQPPFPATPAMTWLGGARLAVRLMILNMLHAAFRAFVRVGWPWLAMRAWQTAVRVARPLSE